MNNETPKRVIQHVIESKSRNQFEASVLEYQRAFVESQTIDYGEDLMVKIHDSEGFHRFDFWVQLKGTGTIQSYEKQEYFSYSINTTNLSKWNKLDIPVVLVLWDIKSKSGYWLLINRFLRSKLGEDPKWLDKSQKRNLPIPKTNLVTTNNFNQLTDEVEHEIQRTRYALKYFSDLTFGSKPANTYYDLSEIELDIQKTPENADLWYEKAVIHYDAIEYNSAYDAIEKARNLAPNSDYITLGYACISVDLVCNDNANTAKHKYFEAIHLFESIREKFPEALIEYNLGRAQGCLGDGITALSHYDKALQNNPSQELKAQIIVNKANTLTELGEDKEELYKEAVETNPMLFQAHASLGSYYRRHEIFEDAKKSYAKAMELNPNLVKMPRFSLWYADILHNLGQNEEALKWVNKIKYIKGAEAEKLRELQFYIYSDLIYEDELDTYLDNALQFYEVWCAETKDNHPYNYLVAQREKFGLNLFYKENNNAINQIILQVENYKTSNQEHELLRLSLLSQFYLYTADWSKLKSFLILHNRQELIPILDELINSYPSHDKQYMTELESQFLEKTREAFIKE